MLNHTWRLFALLPSAAFIPFTLVLLASGATQADVHTISGPRVACISKADFQKFTSFVVDNDVVAGEKLLASGRCMLLAEGQRVYLVNTHVFAGMVEVRIEGETNVLWMATEAITRPADKPVRLPPRQPGDDAPAPAQIP